MVWSAAKGKDWREQREIVIFLTAIASHWQVLLTIFKPITLTIVVPASSIQFWEHCSRTLR